MVSVSMEICAVVACAAGLLCALGMRLSPGRGVLRAAGKCVAGGAVLVAAERITGAPAGSLAAQPASLAAASALGWSGALLVLCARYLL